MQRFTIAAVLMTLTMAGSALATAGSAAVEGARPASHMPEPAAAVLFAVGIGISAWAIRRNRKRS